MSVKQELNTVREDQVYMDTDGDVKVDHGENVPWVKTEHFVQEENSALPSISEKQCVQHQVRTLDLFSGQEGCFGKTDPAQEKEASAMPGYCHCMNSDFTDDESQGMFVQVKEEFAKHNTQMALKSELNTSTDSEFDTKTKTKIYMSKDVDEYLPTSDDVLKNQQDLLKVYRCNTCQYSSNYLFELYKHIISHKMETVYICDLCQSSYQYFLDLKCHLASHTSECKNSSQPFHGRKENFSEYRTSEKVEQPSQNYYPLYNSHNYAKCFTYNYDYTNKLECKLKWQKEPHAGDANSVISDISKCQSEKLKDSSRRENTYMYSCNLCKYICRHLSYLKGHYKRRHTGEKPYSCDLCRYTCATSCDLKQHQRHHTGEKRFSCNLCSYTSARARDVRRHKRRHTGEKPYSCDLCSYTCTKASVLKRHKRHHTGEKPFSCNMCSYTCASACDLKQHKRCHTSEKPLYHCDLCSYTSTRVSHLKQHTRCHTGEKPFSCNMCSYACARAGDLKQHKRCHTGEKPYCCDLCSYTCAKLSYLKLHKTRHTGEKPFSCNICSYTCARACDLKQHKIYHTGEKPYCCDMCSYTCAKPSILKQHKRRHTGEKPYSCDLCSYTCARACDLRRHKRCHIGEKKCPCHLCVQQDLNLIDTKLHASEKGYYVAMGLLESISQRVTQQV